MKTFYLKSLGCKQNQLEGQIIENELIKIGYKKADSAKNADVYLLNSCTVTSHTDSQVNYLLNQAKKNNPKIKTILMGCTAQTYKHHENFNYSNIDLILGNSEKIFIENYIEKTGFFVDDIFQKNEFEGKFLENPNTTRVSIKIQDGCDNRCAYCIIPYARGKSRSNTVENIINQINLVIEKNIKEVVLTGIHIGQWGNEWNLSLIDLLKEIEKTDIPRYRLGSLYVNELNDEIIEFLANSEKFCPHFHLSLQSMCDKTLQNMNRRYTVEQSLKVIEKLHKNFNLPYLGCDIIVGFPDETESDFIETYENLKRAKLSSIHCFPYSKREKTPAYFMENQIQDSIKKERVERIIELSNQLHSEFLELNKNTTQEILIEKKSPKTGLYSAMTKNYIKIYLKSDENLRHTLKKVCLSEFELH